MKERTVHQVGDIVQAIDGRIGTVIGIRKIRINRSFGFSASSTFADLQEIIVKFPDRSAIEGSSENFRIVGEKPFAYQKVYS